ncbi:hypothetical protein B0H13DRAFT_2674987 [Mycena leptocephala]|nr:hypothetical protein B0H13DRAFT_2674987 [Mycena leptocephala]
MSAIPAFSFTTTADEVATAFSLEIKGKNVLITGTSLNGIGFEAARVIAKHANLVIITGYNDERLKLSEDAIKKDVPTANIRRLTLDLGSFAGIRKAAKAGPLSNPRLTIPASAASSRPTGNPRRVPDVVDDSNLMATGTDAPSGLDEDPTAYLALPRFNNTLHFQFELPGTESHTANVTYALTDAPPDGSWPVLVFFNGLGGHRLIAAMTEGIARSHRVQILTLDKPNAGIPLAARTRWMHAALLAVLAHRAITRFALFSHSNGLFYALYTLLHLPPTLTATTWTLTGPFVPASISGSVALRLAAALPRRSPVVPPIARAVSWSGGLLSLSAGLLSPSSSSSPTSSSAASADSTPPHQRGYIDRTIGPACRAAIMRRGMAESRAAMGQEALLCLHGGDAAPRAGAASTSEDESDSVWGLGAGATDADVLRGAFTRLAGRYPSSSSSSSSLGLQIRVVYGAADGLVPVRGRTWLKGVLEDAGLVKRGVQEDEDADAWTEVPDAGHDDVLFLEEVVGGILRRVE